MPFPKPAAVRKTLTPIVARLLVARAEHEILAEEMDAVDTKLLAGAVYTDELNGERITEAKWSWTMSAEQAVPFYALRDDYIAANHTVPERGYCPALIAEGKVRDLNRELIEAGTQFFTELTYDNVTSKLDMYDKTVEALTGLAMAA